MRPVPLTTVVAIVTGAPAVETLSVTPLFNVTVLNLMFELVPVIVEFAVTVIGLAKSMAPGPTERKRFIVPLSTGATYWPGVATGVGGSIGLAGSKPSAGLVSMPKPMFQPA